MKVTIVSQTDSGGGAGLAAGRLHSGLRKIGVQSQMLVASSSIQSDQFTHLLPNGGLPVRIANRFLQASLSRAGLNNLTAVQSFGFGNHPQYAAADIVNFHNLHGGYFNYLALPKLSRHQPVVLTLHDMWPFTGHCIYSYDCERWKIGCGRCPYPKTYPEIHRDATQMELRLKKWAWQKSNMTVIAISRWMERMLRESILKDHPIHYIPNGVDLDVFRPLDRSQCRQLLGLPPDLNLVLFAAADIRDRRKGVDLLIQALAGLSPKLKSRTALVIMGKASDLDLSGIGMETYPLGYIQDDRLKAQVFSAADVFAFPTRADNLPLVLQESMACGTPLVSFDIGGVPDLVRPEVTGLLATAEDARQFGQLIEKILNDSALQTRLSHSCQLIAEREYSLTLQAQRYEKLFQGLMETSKK